MRAVIQYPLSHRTTLLRMIMINVIETDSYALKIGTEYKIRLNFPLENDSQNRGIVVHYRNRYT